MLMLWVNITLGTIWYFRFSRTKENIKFVPKVKKSRRKLEMKIITQIVLSYFLFQDKKYVLTRKMYGALSI